MGISLVAAVLEQKVWVETSQELFPNLYLMLVGDPGTGKTRTMRIARILFQGIEDMRLAPLSMTWASLADALVKAERRVIRNDRELTYNSMYICADEMGAFINRYDHEMVDGLSALYDPTPYTQTRRTNHFQLEIESPQINMICGSTPQNLSDMLPDKAWGQGFMSRVIMVYSNERILQDDFAEDVKPKLGDLLHDLQSIANLYGKFHVEPGYRELVWEWRQAGEPPVPGHPKLLHYNTRRKVNLYKLSMIAAAERGSVLALGEREFNQALAWLKEAEREMEGIFLAGAVNSDSQAMDEILHHIMITGRGHGVSGQAITRFARNKIPLMAIDRIVKVLEASGQIQCVGEDTRTGTKYYKVVPVRDILRPPLTEDWPKQAPKN